MTTLTPDLRPMLERLERLEKQNRRLKQWMLLCLGIVGLIALVGWSAPGNGIIEARGFVLKDEAGKVRASLGIAALNPGLDFFDGATGNVLASLTAGQDGSVLILNNSGGIVQASLGVSSHYGPHVDLADAHGKIVAGMGMTAVGPDLEFRDAASGKVRARLGISRDGGSTLEMNDASTGSVRALVGITADGPTLAVLDTNDRIRGRLGMTAVGADLEFYGTANDNAQTRLGTTADGSSLEVYDTANGNRRVTLGLASGTPLLGLYDASGKTQAFLAVPPEGSALLLYDLNGNPKYWAPPR